MKRKILTSFLTVAIATSLIFGACFAKPTKDPNIEYYTCPMHPQIHQDEPGECPICHMTLVPVYKEGASSKESSDSSSQQAQGVSISSERQQLIGLKKATVTKKTLTKEIKTTGRIAFDPELAVAQKEYLEAIKNIPSIKEAAKKRLQLLGLGDDEIRQIEKGKTQVSNLYLPNLGDTLWVYATLYESEMNQVQPGDEAIITLPASSTSTWVGLVRSVDPVLDATTRSVKARIEIKNSNPILKPDTFVNVVIQKTFFENLTIPRTAVMDTGTRQIAFVIHDGNQFETREIKTGDGTKDEVIVLLGLSEGDPIVSSAAFFVDSESKLKAAVKSIPTCPEGESWDVGMAMCMPKIE